MHPKSTIYAVFEILVKRSRRKDDELGDFYHYFMLRATGGNDGNKEKKIENAQTRHLPARLPSMQMTLFKLLSIRRLAESIVFQEDI